MAAKGTIAKEKVIKKIEQVFGSDYIGIYDKKIYLWSEENGEKIYITKGINNIAEDPSIKDNQIYGKVVGKIPVITEINHIIKNQYGFFFLIFVPLVAVIFLEIADTITEMKRDKKDKEAEENGEKEEII